MNKSITTYKFIYLLLACLFTMNIQAQTIKQYEKAGDEALSKKNYFSAYTYYQNALEIDSSSIALHYKFAESARLWSSYREADWHYQKVLSSPEKELFPLATYQYAVVKKHLQKYVAAKKLFESFVQQNVGNRLFTERAKEEIEACAMAQELMKKPQKVKIKQLSKSVNTNYSEFAPYLMNDELYYSSLRFKSTNEKGQEIYYAKIMTKKPEGRGRPMSKKINIEGLHNANLTFSHDGKMVYFTRCEPLESGEIRCAIYQRDLTKRRPKDLILPNSINKEKTTATHPTIHYDETTKTETLYFVSDRIGGEGGLDIWYSVVKSNGTFSKPKNLGQPINTVGDEITPFYQNDTFYFSSNQHIGFGGYDVFKTNLKDKVWQQPENLGMPINSSYNDIYFVKSQNGEKGYISSNRLGSYTLTKDACCNDIYELTFRKKEEKIEQPVEEEVDTPQLIVTTPVPTPQPVIKPDPVPQPIISSKPLNPTKPTDWNELSKVLPIQLYFDNDHPDPRTRNTVTLKTYEQTYFQYYGKKEEFVKKYTSPLRGETKIVAEDKVRTFFDGKVKFGYDKLNGVMDLLLKKLKTGDAVTVYIKGFTSPRASSRYNEYLAKRRISSVQNYLKTYRNGMLSSFFRKGQLRVIEVPMGETTASKSVSDNMKDRRNSVYSVEASQERRVEIIDVR